MTAIRFSDVSFAFDGKSPLYKKLNCEFRNGSLNLLQGPSGAGKSTLLRLIARLEIPSEGEIFYDDRPLTSFSVPRFRRLVMYIQQTPTVLDDSVRKNLLLSFGFKANKELTSPTDSLIRDLLDEYYLDDVGLEQNALNLSVGQRQRLCFIRGLLLDPEVVLLDEPTSALDNESAAVVERAAEAMVEKGLLVIMVSHRHFRPEKAGSVLWDVKNASILQTAVS